MKFVGLLGGFYFFAQILSAQPAKPVNILEDGNFQNTKPTINNWLGLDEQGNICTLKGDGLVTNDTGQVVNQNFPPCFAAADMNGDGLIDLISADGYGTIWWFQNIGTKEKPLFKRGEVLPIKMSLDGRLAGTKIDLVDTDGDGKLDLILGNYEGHLYFIRNQGTSTQLFVQPENPHEIKIPPVDRPWFTYLAPSYADWEGNGVKDLIVGDGTYASDNIYLFRNKGNSENPKFEPRELLIKGEGREHLTPVVIDWNGDGKPDIVTGDRGGYITIFLNTATKPEENSFAPGQVVKIGTADKFDGLARPAFADLNGDGLFDMILGNASGQIFVSYNIGTKGSPKFGPAVPLKGQYTKETTLQRYLYSPVWGLSAPAESRYHILQVVSKDEKNTVGYEKGFDVPNGSTNTQALKLSITKPVDLQYDVNLAANKELDYSINYPKNRLSAKNGTRYEISCYYRGSGFTEVKIELEGREEDDAVRIREDYKVEFNLSPSDSWSRLNDSFILQRKKLKFKDNPPIRYNLKVSLKGQGTFYLDEISIIEK